jgi:4-amino-4-deoxy-L-arabinose transferase-like glycosyltransferase
MSRSRSWRNLLFSDTGILILLALARLLLQTFTNGNYGFHRDELALIDDAHYLAWGYVAYPPIAPFVARVALDLFGPSLIGLRFFSVLLQCVAMVVAGLIARELGGRRWAQILAALAVGLSPASVAFATMYLYDSYNYLAWIMIAYFVIRLLKSENPRWWLAIGAAIGFGMMSKYAVGFYVAGLVGGILLTKNRRYLLSPWLWAGAGVALLIFLPNLIWQVQHHFISLTFLSSIHARDVAIGRTQDFLPNQVKFYLNLVTVILIFGGLYYTFFDPAGRRYRVVGWMFLLTLVLLMLTQGRDYYLTPAYPVLIAAGAVWLDNLLSRLPEVTAARLQAVTWTVFAVFSAAILALAIPLAPPDSAWFKVTSTTNGELKEMIGWPELVGEVARIYNTLSPAEKPVTAIMTGNYGQAGAIDLYGPAYGLPRAISGINSYWWRGYGDPPPQTVITVGFTRKDVDTFFTNCVLAGHSFNKYNVKNEETVQHPDMFLCRGLRKSWPDFWKNFQDFG